MDLKSEKIDGDIIWAERSHSPPNQRDYQKQENIKRWKKLSDWAESLKKKDVNTKNK